MEITIALLVSLITNITTELGKNTLARISGDNTIADKLGKAFDKALKNWAVNKDIRERESIHVTSRITLLKQIVLQYNSEESIDKGTKELLALFKIEIMNDAVTYSVLIDNYWQDSIKRSNRLEGKIDNIQEIIGDISNNLDSNKENISTEVVPLRTEEKQSKILHNHFIENFTTDPLYILRKLISHKKITDDSFHFNEELDDENLELYKLISSKSRITVLGSAGTGKTMELKQASIVISSMEEYYPIYLPLNLYTPDNSIEDFLPIDWKEVPENKVVVLLDGLDEIEPAKFSLAKRRIGQFTLKYPNAKLIISCRTNFYDLPNESKVGTLRGFEPYYLQDLTIGQVSEFIEKHHGCNGKDFIDSVYENNFVDLVYNPFFLKLLIQNYISNNFKFSRKRGEIFREFINSRIELDENHYTETINIRDEKYRAFRLLRRISLAMEIVGVRIINDVELRQIIPEYQDFKLVTYCTVFKKEDGSSDKWKYEHNYFQEFLCAELLSKQTFDTVISFICNKELKKVLPTWFNTVAQLISILNINDSLFKELTSWLIANDAEVLVNVEREKLSLEIREEIFIHIFNYYKKLKIWIDSNKFNDKDLAYFGQSVNCIKFTEKQIFNETNHRTTRLNALAILGGFDINSYSEKSKLKNAMISLIKEKKADSYFAYSIVQSINNCKFIDSATTAKIFSILGHEKSQYIRASMYKYLVNVVDFEEYVDYFIEGFNLLKSKVNGRDDTNLADERWHLKIGLKKFKTPAAVSKILDFYVQSNGLDYDHDANEILKNIISNSEHAYNEDQQIYYKVLELMKYHSKHWHNEQPIIVLSFFNKTSTKLKAFQETLSEIKNNASYDSMMLLSYLTDSTNYYLIIDDHLAGSITPDTLTRIYWDINNINHNLAEEFRLSVQKKADYTIVLPEKINWDELRLTKSQKSFDLLFDYDGFRKECIQVFGKRDEISKEELFKYKSRSSAGPEIDEKYAESAVSLIRDFARHTPANLEDVKNWINKKENYDWYLMEEVSQYLKNNDKIVIQPYQIDILKEWYLKYIHVIDFTKAITKKEGGTFSINNYARYLTFLIKKFDFDCPESILLDMLLFSFGNIIGMETIQFEFILNKVEKDKVDQRVIENIKNRIIFDFSIYETHVSYAFKNKLSSTYPTIFDDLCHSEFENYQKNRLIDLYFETGNDVDKVKEAFDQFEIETKLHIIKKLINKGYHLFSSKRLQELHLITDNKEYLRIINNFLIDLGLISGLDNTIEWIECNKRNPFSIQGQGLANFEDIKSLEPLLKLLVLSYDKTISSGHQSDRMWGTVINGIEHLALSSKENFEIVILKLEEFIVKNIGELEEVTFINRPLQGIKEKFYKKATKKLDFGEAIEKVEQLIKDA